MVVVAVIAVAIAFVNLGVTLNKIFELNKATTGYAVNVGSVNLSIISARDINFSRWMINWSIGSINTGSTNATLTTYGEGTPTVVGGNWSTGLTTTKALILENIGTSNASLTLSTVKDASDMFGGTSTLQAYMWNISSKEANGANTTCSATSETMYKFVNVNKTTGGKFCNHLGFLQAANEIYIDILLQIPYDYSTSSWSDVITATAGNPSG
ncbi:hypothetical protein FJZ19_04300 [Candidatus Pacearchaeota archaeon]|nr:hypothetical protein [Candidatus Pacearchaeota archaeon]